MNKLQKTQLVLWGIAIVLAVVGLLFSESLKLEAGSAASSYVLHLMSVALVILSGYVVLNYRKNKLLCCMVSNLAVLYTELMYLMLQSSSQTGNQTELYSVLIALLLSVVAFPAYSSTPEAPAAAPAAAETAPAEAAAFAPAETTTEAATETAEPDTKE